MTNAKLLIVADDFTGALDTGVQLARQGIAVRIVMNADAHREWTGTDGEVLVAVTNSRHLPPADAYAIVFRTVAEAKQAGIPYVYKKTDSALRGNIGAELSAALLAGGADMLPFLPAYPRLGRSTRSGRHYIDGVPLSDSVFGQDPLNPVAESDICRLIALQTSVPVWHASTESLRAGCGICVVDAENDEDLERACERLSELGAPVCAGCAGFAAYLPSLLKLRTGEKPLAPVLRHGLLVVSGSLNPVTLRQLAWAEKQGFARLHLTAPGPQAGAVTVPFPMPESRWLILDSSPDGGRTPELQEAQRGETGRHMIEGLAGLLAAVEVEWPGVLMITGGDTLHKCLTRLNVQGIEPLSELFPGVVLSKCSLAGRERLLISKSGGFGEETLMTDLQKLIQCESA